MYLCPPEAETCLCGLDGPGERALTVYHCVRGEEDWQWLRLTLTFWRVSFGGGHMELPNCWDLLLWSCVWTGRTVLDVALGTRCQQRAGSS